LKISAFEIESFGHFAAKTFDVKASFVLLHGPNEAGKTTLLAFLRGLLFGFGEKNPYAFDRNEEMAGSATVRLRNGDSLVFRRRKGRKNPIDGQLGEAKTPVDEAMLFSLLGDANAALFENVFAFGLGELGLGEKSLAHASLTSAIYAGALGGGRDVRAVLASLETSLGALYKDRGKNQPIAASFAEYLRLRDASQAAALRAKDFALVLEQSTEANARAAKLKARLEDERIELAALERIQKALPPFARRQAAIAELAVLVASPATNDGAQRRVLERAPEIRRLAFEEVQLRATQDVVDPKKELRALAADVARRMPGWDLEMLRTGAPDVLRLQALASARVLLDAKLENFGATIADAEKQLAQVALEKKERETELADAPDEALRDIVERAPVHAELARAREVRRARCESLSRDLQTTRARLEPPIAIKEPRVPDVEVVREQRTVLEALALAHQRAGDELSRARKAVDAAMPDTGPASSARSLPSLESLAEKRAYRDKGIELLGEKEDLFIAAARKSWLGKRRIALADAVREAVVVADVEADALFGNAAAVTARAAQVAALEQATARVVTCEGALAGAAERLNAFTATWNALWRPAGIVPHPPAPMEAWLLDFDRIARSETELRVAEEKMAAIDERLHAFLEEMKRILPDAGPGDDLATLSERCRKRQASLQSARARIEESDRQQARLETLVTRTQALAAELAEPLGAWKHAWASVAAPFGDAPPEEVYRRASELSEARAKLVLLQERAAYRRANEEAQATWEGQLNALYKQLAPELDGRTCLPLVELLERAERTEALEREMAALEEQIAGAAGATALATFFEVLARSSPIEVEAQRREIARSLAASTTAFEQTLREAAVADNAWARLDGTSESARLLMEAESKRTELGELVDRWAPMAIAKHVLTESIARFERENQPALLIRVSALFEQVTAGEYVRVRQRLGEHDLLVVARGGAERKVDQLSTGTRELLFLAIRLAYVGAYCEKNEPLPIVMDDVLVNFDGPRAKQLLLALRDVSLQTQVLFFTCHPHIVALAREVFPDARAIAIDR
jgi:uncharacterized protein YhaN